MRLPFLRKRGSVAGATWISDRIAVALIGDLPERVEEVQVRHGRVPVDTHAGWTSYMVVEGEQLRPQTALIMHFRSPPAGVALGLDIRVNGRTVRIMAGQLAAATLHLRAFLRQVAGLGSEAREQLLSAITESANGELAETGSYALARTINQVRDALRSPLEVRIRSMHDRQAIQIERILGIDERSFWARGWFVDRGSTDPRIILVSPEGHRIPVLANAHRHARPDVDEFFAGARLPTSGTASGAKHGFIAHVETPSPSLVASGWIGELLDAAGGGIEVESPPIETDVATVRQGILADLKDFAIPGAQDGLLPVHGHPALIKLQERLRESAHIDSVTQHGTPPDSPTLSIIVPLYGRIDFMEHQLCQFMHDPAIRQVDLIYVLDSPELVDRLARLAAELHALYELPFRTVVLSRNAGYPIANNLGASLARGRLLLLLNSDVVPDEPGWARTLSAFYDATPDIGALGPKLLYEDGSLQHAGLYFDREAGSALWTNLHYFKGLQSEFEAANIARSVPAVTGACMMIDRSLWEAQGGLSSDYVQGGYEDSDLCLRLLDAGRDNWYLPQVELHHLEDQSFPSQERQMATTYNAWLQTQRWGDRIEALMREERYSPERQRATY